MKKLLGFTCTICNKDLEWNPSTYTCPSCGTEGILDVKYDYEFLKGHIDKKYFAENKNYTMWRYAPLMSIEGKKLKQTLKVGWTPLYRSERLAKHLGLEKLYIKDDGLNPTGSLKDRASAVAVAKAMEAGWDTIACSSTGNAASSLAGNAASMGLKTVIFVPERAPQGKVAQLLIYGANVISVKGNYQQTFEMSAAAIEKWGWYNRNAAINPHLVEGKKTVSLEIAEQLEWQVPDWVVVSVGDGCTVAGVYKGFYDLHQIGLIDRIPKILAVQAAGCSPLYKAFLENKPFEPTEENTIADSIAVGVPRNPIKALRAVKDSQGTYITVTDEEILAAMKLLGSLEGIFGEPAGVTGLAGLIKALQEQTIVSTESVAFICTGNGLKDVQNAIQAAGEPLKLEPDVKELDKIDLFHNMK
ncbi:threonine synthase [Desulfuribacillus stibiiarsenatis]|uniref:Threonine synthase n=1 Tax=Desulfuribacillus stibiiarsenatis TaxID=1390249 RepID=A0A1E5L2I6_9FIRM|nr:threonine synthase [Desulfuribacillus stibiiarsenatis]OEH84271.1 threonine synthase [Desulfuribacillus stibiiarsenatis]